MKKSPELRIKRTNIWVKGSPGLFHSVKYIDKSIDVLQYKHETEGWVDVPIDYNDNYRVYPDRIERDAY